MASHDTPHHAPGVTRKQILRFIRRYTDEYGISPTLRQIADAVGLQSLGTVSGHIRRMEADGLLTRLPRSARSITLPKPDSAPPVRLSVRCRCTLPAGCTLRNIKFSANVVSADGRVIRKLVTGGEATALQTDSAAG